MVGDSVQCVDCGRNFEAEDCTACDGPDPVEVRPSWPVLAPAPRPPLAAGGAPIILPPVRPEYPGQRLRVLYLACAVAIAAALARFGFAVYRQGLISSLLRDPSEAAYQALSSSRSAGQLFSWLSVCSFVAFNAYVRMLQPLRSHLGMLKTAGLPLTEAWHSVPDSGRFLRSNAIAFRCMAAVFCMLFVRFLGVMLALLLGLMGSADPIAGLRYQLAYTMASAIFDIVWVGVMLGSLPGVMRYLRWRVDRQE